MTDEQDKSRFCALPIERRFVPLPCPFCGCETLTVAQGSTFRWVIGVCDDCGASCGEVRVDTLNPYNAEDIYQSVVEEWNKRHNIKVTGRPTKTLHTEK